jgi:DNA-binding CsgD family transcriptional regulator
MGLGVRGILRKTLPTDLQVTCLKKVRAGELWFEKTLTVSFLHARRVALTQREGQLVSLLSEGLREKEIATTLMISEGTVKVYLSRLFQKVGVKDRFELALFGLKNLTTGQLPTGEKGGSTREPFLRGARVPRPVQFHSCFISYSTRDREFAERLHADLQAKGVRCWFAPHDMKGGDRLHDQIDRAIEVHDRLLLLLSEASVASKWVEAEIRKALAKEQREARRVLFPISAVPFEQIENWKCFDSDTGEDLARKVREYFIPDFSRWKDSGRYEIAFQLLLRDLEKGQT